MQTTENREELLIDEYLNEIMSREKPDVQMYQGTIDFILVVSVQKIIAELDELRKLVLDASEKHAYSVLKSHIVRLESIYGQSGSNRAMEARELRDLCVENDFKTASRLFIEEQLFRTYKVDKQRLVRLPSISYDNFFYYNRMAPNDVDIAEDVHYLNEQVNRFFYRRFSFDIENLGLVGPHSKNNLGNNPKNRSHILEYLADLIDTYEEWKNKIQINERTSDVLTVNNGIIADEDFLFSKTSRITTSVKKSSSIPSTFKLNTSEEALRRAYKELNRSNIEFGLHTSEAAFVGLFQGRPITSNYKPVVWKHSLTLLVYFFCKMRKENILQKKEWQSHIVNHSLIVVNEKIPSIKTLKQTKLNISDKLEMTDDEMYKNKEFDEFRFILSIVDLLNADKR